MLRCAGRVWPGSLAGLARLAPLEAWLGAGLASWAAWAQGPGLGLAWPGVCLALAWRPGSKCCNVCLAVVVGGGGGRLAGQWPGGWPGLLAPGACWQACCCWQGKQGRRRCRRRCRWAVASWLAACCCCAMLAPGGAGLMTLALAALAGSGDLLGCWLAWRLTDGARVRSRSEGRWVSQGCQRLAAVEHLAAAAGCHSALVLHLATRWLAAARRGGCPCLC